MRVGTGLPWMFAYGEPRFASQPHLGRSDKSPHFLLSTAKKFHLTVTLILRFLHKGIQYFFIMKKKSMQPSTEFLAEKQRII